ncbi:hypothetical protein ACH5RR_000500 [Cinchona calisaya]|uniref:Cytochrome P450 n=1 Tax=Cinchona calisaya TaxID=153742 RepID=A0ABD3B0W0_9GENT
MEIQFNAFLLSSPKYLFLLFSFLILLVKIWKKTKTSSDHDITPKLPPGPTKFPLVGNLHNLVVGGGLPHHVLAGLAKKYGPIMHVQLGEISTVVVSSAKMAKEILVTHHPCFANRPENLATRIIWYEQEDMGFSPYGEYWKQMRKICLMELLSLKSVRSFRFIRQDEISKLVESIIQSSSSAAGVPVNLTEKLFDYTSSVVCRAAFGRICKDKDMMINNLKIAFSVLAGFNLADFFPSLKFLPVITGWKQRLQEVHCQMDEVLEDMITQHKANHEIGRKGNAESGDKDLIDLLLLQQQESGNNHQIPITTRNIKGVILVSVITLDQLCVSS